MENKVIGKNWNLSNISADYSLIDLLVQWKKAYTNEMSLRKNAFKSLENFKKWWFAYLKADALTAKCKIIYNECSKDEKVTDEYKDFCKEIDQSLEEFDQKFKDLQNVRRMLNSNKKKLKSYLKTDKDLAKYEIKFKTEFLSSDGHEISDKERELLQASWGVNALEEVYRALMRDASPEPIFDSKGNFIRSIKNYREGSVSWNEDVRKATYVAWYHWFKKHHTVLFALARLIVARLNQTARYFKYENWIEKVVSEEYQISLKDFYKIIDCCEKFRESHLKFHSYNDSLIAKAYGLKKLEPWDAFEIKNTKDQVSQAEAKKMIFEALSCFGDEYLEKVKSCFEHNIIKWGKNNDFGGYCFSSTSKIDEHPIHFEWDGSTNSVGILAHEIGHNVYSKFTKENNEINDEHSEIFSEIPSVVNSLIFSIYQIKKLKDNKAPKSVIYGAYEKILGYLIGNICNHAYRLQLLDRGSYKLSEEKVTPRDFETFAYGWKNKVCGMTKEKFNKGFNWPNYLENYTCYKYFIQLALNEDINVTYYIGSIVALAIVPKILKGDKKTINKYLKFLKVGTTLSPLKTLKETLGIDLLRPQIYTEAKKQLEELIRNFKKDIQI